MPRALSDTGAETVRGIALACICFFIMTLGDVAAKWALPALGPAGIMIGRALPGGLTVFGYAMLRTDSGPAGWRRLRPVRWKLALLRALLASLTTAIWFIVWQRRWRSPTATRWASRSR